MGMASRWGPGECSLRSPLFLDSRYPRPGDSGGGFKRRADRMAAFEFGFRFSDQVLNRHVGFAALARAHCREEIRAPLAVQRRPQRQTTLSLYGREHQDHLRGAQDSVPCAPRTPAFRPGAGAKSMSAARIGNGAARSVPTTSRSSNRRLTTR
jgi:hypothetical protein